MKTGLTLKKNLLQSLARSAFIPLGLTAAASAADISVYKKKNLRNYSTKNFNWRNGRYRENS